MTDHWTGSGRSTGSARSARSARWGLRARGDRLRSKAWHIGQASVAAGTAYFLAADVFGHPTPFFAPIAALVSLGTSYGQRLRRVVEVTLGVALGVLMADLVRLVVGGGAWQISLIVVLSMSVALLLDAGAIFVTQAAVQSVIILTLALPSDQALVRWTDALIGGGVALVAAAVVPGAPLRRPREQAALVVDRTSGLLRGAADGIRGGDVDATMDLLADARATDALIRELKDAADEGLSVVRSSPFRVRHRDSLRQLTELVEPLDLALRNTRVLVRRVAVATYRGVSLPGPYAAFCDDLAAAMDQIAEEMRADRLPEAVQPRLLQLGRASAELPRSDELSAEVVLAQLRSVIADLLRLTGLDPTESTDAIPPSPA